MLNKKVQKKNILIVIICIFLLSNFFNEVSLSAANQPIITYSSHIQNKSWLSSVSNGEISGSTGQALRMESVIINAYGLPSGSYIEYQSHVQNIGWMNWVKSGEISGTTGKALRVEAFRMRLVNAPLNYDIQYQVHVQDIGWMNWAKNGEMSGTTGKALRVEAIRVQIVVNDLDVSYSGHIQNIGWTGNVSSNENSYVGSPQNNYRLEAFKLKLTSLDKTVRIKSQAYLKSIGWQSSVYDGNICGTVGQSLPIEGLKIQIENAPLYTIDYQAYFKNAGWTSWKSNGEILGNPGNGDIMTALRIRSYLTSLRPNTPDNPIINFDAVDYSQNRVAIDIGHNVNYDSGAIGIRNENELNLEVGTKVISKLKNMGYDLIETKPVSAISLLDSLSKRTTRANVDNAKIFASIHFNIGGGRGTEIYYQSEKGKLMARGVLDNFISLGYNNRGLKYGDFYVLRNTNMPAILIECSFLDSTEDMSRYNSENISTAISNGLKSYLGN